MEDVDARLFFIEQMSQYSAFESLILPRALQIFSKLENLNFLLTLAKVVLQKTKEPSDDFEDLPQYKLMLNSSALPLANLVLRSLTDHSENVLEKSENCICSLILIRHIEPMDASLAVQSVIDFVKKLLTDFDSCEEKKETCLFMICASFETLLHFKQQYCDSEKKIELDILLTRILRTIRDDQSLIALRILDLFLALSDKLDFGDEQLCEVHEVMEKWLSSPQKNGRLLALHVLQNLQKFKTDETWKKKALVIDLCLDAEKVPLTLAQYREKLRLLDRLKCENLDLEDADFKVHFVYLFFYTNYISQPLFVFSHAQPLLQIYL